MKNNILSGYNIIVTAGSTWIPIDTVRVITNIFKGRIGYTIAMCALKFGANVTLIIGDSFNLPETSNKKLKIIKFKYFDELDKILTQELQTKKYDAIVHSAAVSDFKLSNVYNGKIKSNVDKLIIELVPTKKIVDSIKKIDNKIYLVKFKLEVGINEKELINIATRSMISSNADLIVANIYSEDFSKSKEHSAIIIDKENNINKVIGKENIAKKVIEEIYENVR